MKKLFNYVLIENKENKFIFALVGLFVIFGIMGNYVDGNTDSNIWIYGSGGIGTFWLTVNIVAYYRTR